MLTDVQRAEITAAAHRGAWLMDEHGPSGWALRVNPDTLRMDSTMHCVLGQSMPDRRRLSLRQRSSYCAKLHQLGITRYDQVRYGFDLPDYVWCNDEAWAALADAWRNEIAVRVTMPDPIDVREPLVLAV